MAVGLWRWIPPSEAVPVDPVPYLPDSLQFQGIQRPPGKGLQPLEHLVLVPGTRQADIDGGMGEGEPIAVRGGKGFLSRWHLLGLEEPPPACGGVGGDSRPVVREVLEDFGFSSSVGWIVSDLKDVEG